MDSHESKKYQQAEQDIESLFAKCTVPNKGSSNRIADILVRGLHELSLRDLIQFSSKIAAAMLDILLRIGTAQKPHNPPNGEQK
jgi:hypothetical protein